MMPLKLFSYRKLLMISPILAVGLCFQNFSELDVPHLFQDDLSKPMRATSVQGAAEELLRREMPEIGRLESKLNDKLQFRWGDPSNREAGEVQLGLLESTDSSANSKDNLKLSLVNDKLRFDFAALDVACDYTPGRGLVSVRTSSASTSHLVFEHSGRDQQSRVNWQMSW